MRRDGLAAVAWKQSKVHQRCRSPRKDVLGPPGVENGERRRRPERRIGARGLLQLGRDDRAEEPEIAEQHAMDDAHLGSQGIEALASDATEREWHLFRLDSG